MTTVTNISADHCLIEMDGLFVSFSAMDHLGDEDTTFSLTPVSDLLRKGVSWLWSSPFVGTQQPEENSITDSTTSTFATSTDEDTATTIYKEMTEPTDSSIIEATTFTLETTPHQEDTTASEETTATTKPSPVFQQDDDDCSNGWAEHWLDDDLTDQSTVSGGIRVDGLPLLPAAGLPVNNDESSAERSTFGFDSSDLLLSEPVVVDDEMLVRINIARTAEARKREISSLAIQRWVRRSLSQRQIRCAAIKIQSWLRSHQTRSMLRQEATQIEGSATDLVSCALESKDKERRVLPTLTATFLYHAQGGFLTRKQAKRFMAVFFNRPEFKSRFVALQKQYDGSKMDHRWTDPKSALLLHCLRYHFPQHTPREVEHKAQEMATVVSAAIIKIQSLFRSKLRQGANKINGAAIKIQCLVRRGRIESKVRRAVSARKWETRASKASTMIQSHIRGKLARLSMIRAVVSAVRIQRHVRGKLARLSFCNIVKSAVTIQCLVRGVRGRRYAAQYVGHRIRWHYLEWVRREAIRNQVKPNFGTTHLIPGLRKRLRGFLSERPSMRQKRVGQAMHDQASWCCKMQKRTDFVEAKKTRALSQAWPRQPIGIPQRNRKCYLNSTLQALLACGDPVSDFFAEASLVSEQASALSSAFRQLRGGDGNVSHEELSPLPENQHHDPQQWMMGVITSIVEETSLPSPFSFTKKSIKQCQECRCVRQCVQMEEMVMPVVGQDESHEAQDWVGKYFDFSNLPGCVCTECGRDDSHREWTENLVRTPEILVLDIALYGTGTDQDGQGVPKLNKTVKLSAEQGNGEPESYKLVAATVYRSARDYQQTTTSSGHYVCYRRGVSGRGLDGIELDSSDWFEMNDTKVTPTSFDEVRCLTNVRALFYKKMGKDEKDEEDDELL